MCGLSGVPPSGSIPLVALRTPAGTGCARPSNPCRALPWKNPSMDFSRDRRFPSEISALLSRPPWLNTGRQESGKIPPFHPRPVPELSRRAGVEAVRHPGLSNCVILGLDPGICKSRHPVPEPVEGPRKKNQKNPKKKKNTLDTFLHRVYIHTHRNERRGTQKDV